MSQTDDYAKKFQLTDSLLRRLLDSFEYEQIKIVEPVIIVTDDVSSKQLRSPGYKHAVVSSSFFYVVNTPAKTESDLIFKIELAKVKDVSLIHDVADFLQGDLQKDAQHIQLSCSSSDRNVAEGLILQAETLSLLSLNNNGPENIKGDGSSIKTSSQRPLSDYLSSFDESSTVKKPFIRCSSMNESTSSSHNGTAPRWKSLPAASQILPSRGSSRRPLPKPMTGTETLNASYTSAQLKNGMGQSIDSLSLQPASCGRISPSKSVDDLTKKASLSNHKLQNAKLNSSFPSTLSTSRSLSKSWNDIFKEANDKKPSDEDLAGTSRQHGRLLSDASVNSVASSKSLGQSFSARLFSKFKSSRENIVDDTDSLSSLTSGSPDKSTSISSRKGSLQSTTESEYSNQLSSSSRKSSIADKDNDDDAVIKGGYLVHVYTVSKTSSMFNVMRASWINELFVATMLLKEKPKFQRRSPVVTRKHPIKLDVDAIIQKVSNLQEEVLTCKQDDQLFLLTKELKFACEKYQFVKKFVWKSGGMLKLYLRTLKRLIRSRTTETNTRMDELDVLIIIGEFFICIFQGTELVSHRNLFLNENSASYIKDLFACVVTEPVMSCETNDDELKELLDSWTETCTLLLYEIITAAQMSSWNCALIQRSFNTTLLADLLLQSQSKMKPHLDEIFNHLTSVFTTSSGSSTKIFSIDQVEITPTDACLVYKYFVILAFICKQCMEFGERVKIDYQEEIKYYINKDDNIDRIPSHYPICVLLHTSFPKWLSSLTKRMRISRSKYSRI